MQNFITKSRDLALTFYLNYKQNMKPFISRTAIIWGSQRI